MFCWMHFNIFGLFIIYILICTFKSISEKWYMGFTGVNSVPGTKQVRNPWSEKIFRILESDTSRFNLAKSNRLQTARSKSWWKFPVKQAVAVTSKVRLGKCSQMKNQSLWMNWRSCLGKEGIFFYSYKSSTKSRRQSDCHRLPVQLAQEARG